VIFALNWLRCYPRALRHSSQVRWASVTLAVWFLILALGALAVTGCV
jgi:hypothetical protein